MQRSTGNGCGFHNGCTPVELLQVRTSPSVPSDIEHDCHPGTVQSLPMRSNTPWNTSIGTTTSAS